MAASLDEKMAVADVYADALYELAKADGAVADTRSELDELLKLHDADPDFAEFLVTGALNEDQRAASLEKMFRGKLSDRVLDTLLVMNAHGRCGLMASLHRCLVLRDEEERNEIEAVATSAVELSDERKAQVVKLAEEKADLTPLVKFVVDPAILGGLILQIGDWRYDNSLRRQLREAKVKLGQRGDRGLEVGVTR